MRSHLTEKSVSADNCCRFSQLRPL